MTNDEARDDFDTGADAEDLNLMDDEDEEEEDADEMAGFHEEESF